MSKKKTINVAGIEFNADQVKSVTLKIDGRKIHIYDKDKKDAKKIGFKQ